MGNVLPAEMGEGLVGFGHLVRVFALLDCGAAMLGGIQQLASQAVFHALLATLAGCVDHPAHCQRGATRGTHVDRALLGGTTNATRLDLDSNGRRAWWERGV